MNRVTRPLSVLLTTLAVAALFTVSAIYLPIDPSPRDPAHARSTGTTVHDVPALARSVAEAPLGQAVRGRSGDLWADVILGKADFSQIGPGEIVPYKTFNPGGVAIDRSVTPGRAYVWDAGNSRILGIDLAKCYAGESPCSADIVIGQPAASDHGACNGDSGVQNFPNRAPGQRRHALRHTGCVCKSNRAQVFGLHGDRRRRCALRTGLLQQSGAAVRRPLRVRCPRPMKSGDSATSPA